MKKRCFIIISILLIGVLSIYAEESSKNNEELLQITDTSKKPLNLKVAGFEPAKISPRVTDLSEERKTFLQKFPASTQNHRIGKDH